MKKNAATESVPDIWKRCRLETPGADGIIHLNHAGASLMPHPVLERYHRHLDLEARLGGYEAADSVREEEAQVYDRLARLLNCRDSEIALLDSATRAWSMAFYSIPFQTGDRILTCSSEYASNFIAYLQLARRVGLSVEVVPDDDAGVLSLDHLRQMMDERVRLVAVTHVPTNGGLINPIQEIGRISAQYDCFYLVDACQSVGQLVVDVERIGCDFLSGTGRKYLRGPRGTGFLYVSHRALSNVEPPMLDLHSASWTAPDRMHIRPDGKCFEMWEYNVAARLAFSEAVAYAIELGMEQIETHVCEMGDQLRSLLMDIPRINLLDLGKKRCGIVSFNMDGFDADELVDQMHHSGINLNVSPARHTLIDMNRRGIDSLVRASVHYTNTTEEMERFAQRLREI